MLNHFFFYYIKITGEASNGQPSVKTNNAPKLQSKAEKEEQVSKNKKKNKPSIFIYLFNIISLKDHQSSALAAYFNKTDDNDEDDKTPWDDIKTNDWGDTQEISNDKWENFSASSPSPSSSQPKQTVNTSTVPNPALWVQDKPSPTSQTPKNDWDSDAFFNDVLTTATKPKLKTSRRP